MRKLLALLVVLSLASSALGGQIDLKITSLNGTAITPVSEITINQSDTVDLTIVWNGLTGRYLFGLSSIVQKTGPGTLNLNNIIRNPDFDKLFELKGTTGDQQWIAEVAHDLGVPGVTGQTQALVSNLLLHCDSEGDILIKLLEFEPTGPSLEIDDQINMYYPTYGPGVIIHSVPEPATLLLLGLGGLFLRRKK